MDAAILAGGEGRRLKPLTESLPKPLIPLAGEPLFHYVFRKVREFTDRKYLLAGGDPEPWISYADNSPFRDEIILVLEERPLGTGGALKAIFPHMHLPVMVVNGDLVLDFNPGDLIAAHRKNVEEGALATVVALHVHDRKPYGAILLDGSTVRGFEEKGMGGEGWIFGGVGIFESGVKEYFPPSTTVSLERELLPELAREGLLKAHRVKGRFSDAGTLQGLVEAQRIIMDSELWPFRSFISSHKGVSPPVYISSSAHVDEGAAVGPYATVLEGVRILKGASVKDSLILEGAIVERGAEVASSVVRKGVRVKGRERVLNRIL